VRLASYLVAALALSAPTVACAEVIVPEGNGCPEASLTADAKAEFAGDTLSVHGHYKGAGPASGVLLEYRVDSDRYRAETRPTPAGDFASAFPFSLCGDHVVQVWAFPVVAAGERQAICLERGIRTRELFSAPCGSDVRLSGLHWDCEGSGSCSGNVTASVGDGKSDYVLMASVGQAPFRQVGSTSPGPFQVPLTCHSGEKIRLRARLSTKAAHNGVAELVCGVS
jgi:hypothetical protein